MQSSRQSQTTTQRRQSVKHSFALRKQISTMEVKQQQWKLPSEHNKILLYLALIRKVIRATTNTIKEKQDKEFREMEMLKKYYVNQTNSFDCIAPTNVNFQLIKLTKDAFVQAKKEIVSFMKSIRSQVLRKQNRKHSETATQIAFALLQSHKLSCIINKPKQNCQQAQNNPLNQTAPAEWTSIPEQACSSLNKETNLSLNPIKNLVTNRISNFNPKQLQLTKKQAKPCQMVKMLSQPRKSRIIKSNKDQYNQYVINLKKLSARVKNQSALFQKFNKTLTNFCEASPSNPNSCNSSKQKGYEEMLIMYIKSMIRIKNKITGNTFRIMRQKVLVKQRMLFLIDSSRNLNEEILEMFNKIAKNVPTIRKKIHDYQQPRSLQALDDIQNREEGVSNGLTICNKNKIKIKINEIVNKGCSQNNKITQNNTTKPVIDIIKFTKNVMDEDFEVKIDKSCFDNGKQNGNQNLDQNILDMKLDLSQYLRRLSYMIEVSKIILSEGYSFHYNINFDSSSSQKITSKPSNFTKEDKGVEKAAKVSVKSKNRFVSNMLTKLSQFRYLATYLIAEIQNFQHDQGINTGFNGNKDMKSNMKLNISMEKYKNCEEAVELRWKKIYDKKYGKLKSVGNRI